MHLLFLAAADSIHSYRWIRYFAERGHTIRWLSLTPLTVGEPIPNVELEVFSQRVSKPGAVLRATLRTRRLLKSANFDLVHSHYAGTYGLIGALAAKDKMMLTAWGSDVLLSRYSFVKRPLLQLILRRALAITCDAQHMADAMVNLGVARRKISIILFGTDTDRFRPMGKNYEMLQDIGVPPSGSVVISLRSLYPIYDIQTLLRAVPAVRQKHPRVTVIVAGGGSEREKLEKLAVELQIEDHVRFCGPVQNLLLPALVASADVYVSTSLSDAGLSASTAEAMACGVPVVVSDSGENRNWIQDGVQGFVIPTGDSVALAKKITWILERPDQARAMGLSGRAEIEMRNSFSREMAKVERLYQDLTSRTGL